MPLFSSDDYIFFACVVMVVVTILTCLIGLFVEYKALSWYFGLVAVDQFAVGYVASLPPEIYHSRVRSVHPRSIRLVYGSPIVSFSTVVQILIQRLKVPPSVNQFNKCLDKNQVSFYDSCSSLRY